MVIQHNPVISKFKYKKKIAENSVKKEAISLTLILMTLLVVYLSIGNKPRRKRELRILS